MKVSRNDPFDLNLCMRGLGVLTTYMHSHIYEFVYYMTFKRSMKSYAKDFKHAWEQYIADNEFFEKIDDPFVQNFLVSQNRLVEFKLELILRFGIEEDDDLENEMIVAQAERFRPYLMMHKRSKSYKKLKLYYERTLEGIIESLYFYACAITVQSYKIPLVFKRQFRLEDKVWGRLLNQDDNSVFLIKELIAELKEDLVSLKVLMIVKPKRKKSV
jgi:hypothetical protein